MLYLSFLRGVAVVALAGMISRCSSWHFWSGPWPRIDINTKGLGESPIGNYIRQERDNHGINDGKLRDRLAKFIAEQTPAKGLSREDAESLGARCAPPPGTECIYSGEYWSRLSLFRKGRLITKQDASIT